MEIINKIRSQSTNKPLFHYTSQSGLLGIILNGSIRATSIHYLNDTQEFQYSMNLIKEELRQFSEEIKSGELGGRGEKVFQMIHDLFEFSISGRFIKDNYHIFVCSFSEDGDLLSQWRSYCPESGGLNIGFDYMQIKQIIEKQGFFLTKCLYKPEEQKATVKRLLHEWGLLYIDNIVRFSALAEKDNMQGLVDGMKEVASELIEAIICLCPLLKNPSFVEEKEWRLVSHPISIGNPQVKFREGSSMLIPFFELYLTNNEGLLSIKSVTIGPTSDPEMSSQSLKAFLKSEKTKYDKVEISKIPYRSW